MPDRPDEFDGRSRIAVPLSRESSRRIGSRTAAAARELLKAFGADLGRLVAQMRRSSFGARTAKAGSARNDWALARGLVLGVVLLGIGGALIVSCGMLWALHGLPLEGRVAEAPKPTLLLEAADGTNLGRVGQLKFADGTLADFPPVLINAVLSIEDRRFYKHFGIDPRGILRAARVDHIAGKVVEGGSTITQQLVKMEYLKDDERTLTRKAREALLAIWLELRTTKQAILTHYLNRVYLGDGAVGMEAASRLYFDKRPSELTLPEAAMLAGLIRAPSALDPVHHLDLAQARAATVLDAMVANHVIDTAQAEAAKAQPATLRAAPRMAQAGSWFTDWVTRPAEDVVGARAGNVRVRTTLVPRLQALAQQVLDQTLDKEGRRLNASQGAMVVMRPDGAVLALVGGRDYAASQFNRAVDARRPPGSAFKLFTYLAALRQGLNPGDTVDASPIDIKGWKPANFDNEQFGRITLADAFAKSVNTASVRLAMQVGLDNVIAAARDLGLDAPLKPMPSIVLGTEAVSLLDLTGAYASVRADRMHVQPWGVSASGPADEARSLAAATPVQSSKSLDPYDKPLIELLQGVVKYGTGHGAALDGFAAGKTGTTQDSRDAWFIGFNDRLVVGVWVGNDDDSPMNRVVGGTLPASIWKQFMTEAAGLSGGDDMPPALPSTSGAPADAGNPPALASPALVSDNQNKAGDTELPLSSGESAPPWCDVSACGGRYHSFRPSDCTYQPLSGGPRQVCAMGGGSVPAQSVWTPQEPGDATDVTIAVDPAQCEAAACASRYGSFRASDCTYQPYGGGQRQRCEGPAALGTPAAGERYRAQTEDVEPPND